VTTENKIELLNAREVAEMLAVSRTHVLKLARLGEIPSIKLGGTWRFRRDAIEQVIESGGNQ
jgi:excisionase family DNA binding protein